MRLGPILDPAMPQATIDIAIKLRDLTVSYEEKPVLRSISMDVPKGEIVGVVGPNGAGKSTLLKAMLGLIHPDAGDIRYYGKMISECRQLVGYVPQTEAVDWDFPVTVLDVVMMGHQGRLGWFGWPNESHPKEAIDALELAPEGVTVNAVHPDAVFDTRLWTPEALATSAARYGLTIDEYKTRNLLKAEIKSRDVALAVCAFIDGTLPATTGAQLPVDGGNDRVI